MNAFRSFSKHAICPFYRWLANAMEQGKSPVTRESSVNKFATFFETECFIVFTRARQWYLFWARWIQSTRFHPISLWFIFIVSSHLPLGLPNCIFPSDFTSNPYILSLSLSPTCASCPAHQNLLDRPNKMSLHIIHSLPTCSYFFSLRPKYRSQHPFLENSEPLFFP